MTREEVYAMELTEAELHQIKVKHAESEGAMLARRYEVESVRIEGGVVRIGSTVEMAYDMAATFKAMNSDKKAGDRATVLGLVKGGNGVLIITDLHHAGLNQWTTHQNHFRKVK